MSGPKRIALLWAILPNIDLRRHVRSRPIPHTLHSTRARCLALFSSRKGAWRRSDVVEDPRRWAQTLHRTRFVHSTRAYGAPPGVPSLTFFQGRALPQPFALRKTSRGAPTGNHLPVRLYRFGRRPSARHRRGRRPFNHPSRDHADGATLGRLRRPGRPELGEAG